MDTKGKTLLGKYVPKDFLKVADLKSSCVNVRKKKEPCGIWCKRLSRNKNLNSHYCVYIEERTFNL